MRKKKIRIVLADDHKVVRSGLRSLFRSGGEFSVVGEAADGEAAIRMVEKLKPDIALIDISMPRLNGIDAVGIIRKKNPETKILILTIHENEAYVDEMIRAGANGYILKNAEKKEIFAAVRSIVTGGTFFSPSISKLMIEGFIKRAKDQLSSRSRLDQRLTKRETEVLRFIAEGLTNKQIAEKLSLSVRTVNTHRSNLMQKLNLHTTAALVQYAIQTGLVTLKL